MAKIQQSNELFELPALLLAIRPHFAERILQGKKKYELRKRLPKSNFNRVYLYVSGGGGIVGCFDVKELYNSRSIDELWVMLGDEATSENRFFQYFRGWEKGCAIGIENPTRFLEPVIPTQLKSLEPGFNAPQSYLYITPASSLYSELESRRQVAIRGIHMKLRPIYLKEHEEYIKLVTKHIAPRYDEIDEAFAKNNLRIHKAGKDEFGILTSKKEVLAIVIGNKRVIGYTTLTYKLGHSIKTGPTIIKPRYRKRGYGLKTRKLLDAYARKVGRYKLYCTCPDNESYILQHFIRAGYRIEGHLRSHYQPNRGEIVLGRVLDYASRPKSSRKRVRSISAATVASDQFANKELIAVIHEQFTMTWFEPPISMAKKIVKNAARPGVATFEEKPIKLLCLKSKDSCVGVLMLVAKRGGAVKALLLSATSHKTSIERIIETAEKELKSIPKRKLYFIHPINDPSIITVLVQKGYRVEASLEQPYSIGQDAFLLAKFL